MSTRSKIPLIILHTCKKKKRLTIKISISPSLFPLIPPFFLPSSHLFLLFFSPSFLLWPSLCLTCAHTHNYDGQIVSALGVLSCCGHLSSPAVCRCWCCCLGDLGNGAAGTDWPFVAPLILRTLFVCLCTSHVQSSKGVCLSGCISDVSACVPPSPKTRSSLMFTVSCRPRTMGSFTVLDDGSRFPPARQPGTPLWRWHSFWWILSQTGGKSLCPGSAPSNREQTRPV